MGQHLSEHPDVRKVGFTGSTPTGKQIMKRYSHQKIHKYTLLNLVLKYLISYIVHVEVIEKCNYLWLFTFM